MKSTPSLPLYVTMVGGLTVAVNFSALLALLMSAAVIVVVALRVAAV